MPENKISWLILGFGVLATAWGVWLRLKAPDSSGGDDWVIRQGRLVERESSEPFQGLREIPFDGAKTLVEWEFNYIDGIRQGPAIEYFPTPGKRVKTRTFYVDGKRQGIFINYHPNGVKKSQGHAVDDDLSGLMTFFDPDGAVSERLVYERSSATSAPAITAAPELVPGPPFEVDENDPEARDPEDPLLLDADGKPYTGTQIGTFYGGGKAFEHSYLDGREDGMHRGWDPDGKPEYEHPYLDRQKHGSWKLWGADSQLLSEEQFHHGLQVGAAQGWFANGQLRQASQFVHGAEHGVRTEFASDGRKFRERTFDHGVLVRKIDYSENGSDIVQDVVTPLAEGDALVIEPSEQTTKSEAIPISGIPDDVSGEVNIRFRFRLSTVGDAAAEANVAREFTVSILHGGIAREFTRFPGELGGGWHLEEIAPSTKPGETLSLEVEAAPGTLKLDLDGIAYFDDSEE